MTDMRAHHYGWEHLHWEGNKLYFQDQLQAELVPHDKIAKHYHLKFRWREVKTPEFFNIFNARENSRYYSLQRLNYNA